MVCGNASHASRPQSSGEPPLVAVAASTRRGRRLVARAPVVTGGTASRVGVLVCAWSAWSARPVTWRARTNSEPRVQPHRTSARRTTTSRTQRRSSVPPGQGAVRPPGQRWRAVRTIFTSCGVPSGSGGRPLARLGNLPHLRVPVRHRARRLYGIKPARAGRGLLARRRLRAARGDAWRTDFKVAAGTVYRIAVGAAYRENKGPFTLRWGRYPERTSTHGACFFSPERASTESG
jgi:hypothetical protein